MSNAVDYVTIATLGNAVDFGDVSAGKNDTTGCASPTRGVFAGGKTPTKLDVIEYVQIMSTGNAIDFGNLTTATCQMGGLSNGHGGLG